MLHKMALLVCMPIVNIFNKYSSQDGILCRPMDNMFNEYSPQDGTLCLQAYRQYIQRVLIA